MGLWWWIYCADFDVICSTLTKFVETFADVYHECGGPQLEADVIKSMVAITALEQMVGLVAAVPQIMRMCPAKNWETIKDRYDPRIAENIDGKSTLRLYLHVMKTVIRMIEEMDADKVLQQWIDNFWVGKLGRCAKSDAAIFGE